MTGGERVERDASLDPVPLEDRLEQAQPVGPEPERTPLPSHPDVPEADALEQAEEVEPGPRPGEPARGFEIPDADAWDQAIEVPMDDPWA
ncbi:MAG TPA: hypothetical protein VE623_08165 [Acidimicrobiales bacterium]|nr:hypothetical protein [Acidimicrobiales bacterium]